MNEEDLPTLDVVVRCGDAAIIRGLRMGRETLEALERLRRGALAASDAGTHVRGGGREEPGDAAPLAPYRPGCGDGSAVVLDPDTLRPVGAATSGTARPPRGAPIGPRVPVPPTGTGVRDHGIDVLLEREVDALRRELRELLCGTMAATPAAPFPAPAATLSATLSATPSAAPRTTPRDVR